MNFFSYDSKFFQFINQMTDCIVLSVLWLLTSLPIVTIGAATTALYYTVNKVFAQEEGSAWGEYFRAFKREFKQATGMWLILLVIYMMIGLDCILIYSYAEQYSWLVVLFWVLMFFLALVMMWSRYWFPYLARFEDSTRVILKNTVYMALFDFKWTLVLLVVNVLEILGCFLFPLLLVILPAASMIYVNHTLEKVFVKYTNQ